MSYHRALGDVPANDLEQRLRADYAALRALVVSNGAKNPENTSVLKAALFALDDMVADRLHLGLETVLSEVISSEGGDPQMIPLAQRVIADVQDIHAADTASAATLMSAVSQSSDVFWGPIAFIALLAGGALYAIRKNRKGSK